MPLATVEFFKRDIFDRVIRVSANTPRVGAALAPITFDLLNYLHNLFAMP